MQWTDIQQIAEELADKYPEEDPLRINFVSLRNHVLQLADFNDEPDRCGEKILEAIQQAWIDEVS